MPPFDGAALDLHAAVARSAPRSPPSPPSKAALSYLALSGAAPICIIDRDGIATFRAANKISSAAIVVFWIDATKVRPVVRRARRLAGKCPTIDDATRALREAATDHRIALTDHAIALQRAGDASRQLDAYFEKARRSGKIAEFNRAFKLRRMVATANGRGFMSYKIAQMRLRRALIPILVSGGADGAISFSFASIFEG
jgi:hypothetical protein